MTSLIDRSDSSGHPRRLRLYVFLSKCTRTAEVFGFAHSLRLIFLPSHSVCRTQIHWRSICCVLRFEKLLFDRFMGCVFSVTLSCAFILDRRIGSSLLTLTIHISSRFPGSVLGGNVRTTSARLHLLCVHITPIKLKLMTLQLAIPQILQVSGLQNTTPTHKLLFAP
jgi:hypothetical protein